MSAERRQAEDEGVEFIAVRPLRNMRVKESIEGRILCGKGEEILTEDISPVL